MVTSRTPCSRSPSLATRRVRDVRPHGFAPGYDALRSAVGPARLAMNDIVLVIIVVVFVALAYGLDRLSARASREITIPFEGDAPAADVKAALERIGCVVVDRPGGAIIGLLRGDGGDWGQEVTVTAEQNRLRVRSSFSGQQITGASKNQENVDRFSAEWERRAEVAAAAVADPSIREEAEAQARKAARDALRGGAVAIAIGIGVLVLAALPAREGASPSGSVRLAGIGLVVIGYGLPRAVAAAARLRKKPGTPPSRFA